MSKRKTKKANRRKKKANITLKRKMANYYWRLTLSVKISLIIFLILFFFTNLFDSFKDTVRHNFSNITAQYGFTLQDVEIEGQENAPVKQIISSMSANKGDAIFAINLKQTKEKLERNIWIKAAIVERRLPDTIYIAIVERKPIAIWQFKGKLYLIDESGNKITAQNIEKFGQLLHLVGQGANIYASNLIETLNQHPKLASKIRSAVRYGNRRWNLNLDEEITVKMPEKDFTKAYNYLNKLNGKNRLFGQNYKILDLRNPQKYYLEKY